MAITVMTSCTKEEGPEGNIMTCTQAYYPTNDVEVIHYTGPNPWGNNDNTNFADRTTLRSLIWTVNGFPVVSRFYLFFDLSGYNKTKKTMIKNISLYLYGHPTTTEPHSSNKTNQHVFNRIISDWKETAITWNNQPDVDKTTSVITDHIPGTLNEPRMDDYVFNLNDILLKNGKLRADYKGISCRPYQENFYDFYRRVCFAACELGDEALFPTLKVEYAFPLPEIKFGNNVFSVANNEDLKILFEKIQYVWTIDGDEKTGESVSFGNTDRHFTVHLQIIITNNIGEICEYGTSRTFEE